MYVVAAEKLKAKLASLVRLQSHYNSRDSTSSLLNKVYQLN